MTADMPGMQWTLSRSDHSKAQLTALRKQFKLANQHPAIDWKTMVSEWGLDFAGTVIGNHQNCSWIQTIFLVLMVLNIQKCRKHNGDTSATASHTTPRIRFNPPPSHSSFPHHFLEIWRRSLLTNGNSCYINIRNSPLDHNFSFLLST